MAKKLSHLNPSQLVPSIVKSNQHDEESEENEQPEEQKFPMGTSESTTAKIVLSNVKTKSQISKVKTDLYEYQRDIFLENPEEKEELGKSHMHIQKNEIIEEILIQSDDDDTSFLQGKCDWIKCRSQ